MLLEFMTATTEIFLLLKYCTEVIAQVPKSECPLFGLIYTDYPTLLRNKNDFFGKFCCNSQNLVS